jgi:hypothetical protein
MCCPLQCGEQNRFSFFPFFARNRTPHRHAISFGMARGFERPLEGDLVTTRYHPDDLDQCACKGSIRHEQYQHVRDRVHVSVPEGKW